MVIGDQKNMMKPFQYDKRVWEDGEINRTWQFGIVGNSTLLWVNYENPGALHHSGGGINILFSILSSSLFSVDIQQDSFCLAFGLFTEYLEPWKNNQP